MRGFSRFLCDSPLGVCCLHPAKNGRAEPQNQPITYKEGTDRSNLPDHHGSYHLRERSYPQNLGNLTGSLQSRRRVDRNISNRHSTKLYLKRLLYLAPSMGMGESW